MVPSGSLRLRSHFPALARIPDPLSAPRLQALPLERWRTRPERTSWLRWGALPHASSPCLPRAPADVGLAADISSCVALNKQRDDGATRAGADAHADAPGARPTPLGARPRGSAARVPCPQPYAAQDEDGQLLLKERPRITDATLAECWDMPAGAAAPPAPPPPFANPPPPPLAPQTACSPPSRPALPPPPAAAGMHAQYAAQQQQQQMAAARMQPGAYAMPPMQARL